MAEVKPGRWTADVEGDFVVFLSGARASRNLRRSCEHPERFANDRDDPHVAARRNYWKRVGKDTRTGIWHGTYLVRAGEYEAVYGDTPPYGLGKASSLVPMSDERPRAAEASQLHLSRRRPRLDGAMTRDGEGEERQRRGRPGPG